MPNYDLVAVWEEHLRSEFVARDVNAPTDTMVPDACVNHVPTMTGGVCRDELKRFYKYHFVKANPPEYRDHSDKPHGWDRYDCR